MIARGASVGAVCLRCRMRLMRHLAPVRYVSNDAAAPTNRTDDRVDGNGDGENGGQDVGRDFGRDGGYDAAQDREYKWVGVARPSTKRLSARKRYLSRNRILQETAARTGSDMLGKPWYAIVMRDRGTIDPKGLPLLPEVPHDATATSVEALLDNQHGTPTPDKVRSSIEALRPQTDTMLLKKDFKKLQRLLVQGFLKAQLQDYLKVYESSANHSLPKTTTGSPSKPEIPWLQELRPWTPLPSQPDVAEEADPTLQGYVSEAAPLKEKEKLALRVMRDCWGLTIAELENHLGETWIKLQDREFKLLMRGTQRFIKTLSEIYLDSGEKIEAYAEQRTLRLVTTKIKSDALVKELDETLREVKTKTFPVMLIGSKAPDPAVLEQLGQITNTYVRKSHNSNRLHVDWIEIKSRAATGLSGLEDLAHIVFRLLLTALGSQKATSSLISPLRLEANTGRLVVDATSKDKFGWKDRMAQWARYVHPQRPEKTVVNAALPIRELELPFEPLARPEQLDETQEFFSDTKFPPHPVRWSNVGQTSTTAHFGHILHSYQPSKSTPLLSDLLTSTERHIFAPSTPHPLDLSKFEQSDPGSSPIVPTKSTIVLRFWPSPSSNRPSEPADTSKPSKKKKSSKRAGNELPAPVLELRLAASDREVKRIESLRAIRRTHHTDVLLPSSLVDLRFTQTQYETLLAPDHKALATWQPLADFFGPARLDLENGKLEMPPRQKFPIPRRLFTATDPSSSSSSSSHTPTSSQPQPGQPWFDIEDEIESVSYEYVGLELHRSATMPFNGHQLTYTSIEAGQGGGRRAEVTLEPIESSAASSSSTAAAAVDKDRLREDFLVCCSRLATDQSLWSGVGNRNGGL
ncbi:hypothetical protein GGR55DRAFT_296781 [Xylaria sp. FL0064]|nr:hypothetical protein GGR55DRAFT_296781 [Xylaria sp. FL0064]